MTTASTDVRFQGKDNYGKPKQEYLDRIKEMTDEQLAKECSHRIWLSAYANNNPRSDYHWQADALYSEASSRGKVGIYADAHAELVKEARG